MKNSQELLQRIDELKKKFADPAYPEDVETIKSWREKLIRAMLMDDLSKHEGIKMILKKYKEEIDEINELLLSADSTKLNDKERDRLLDKRYMYEDFVGLLESPKKEMEMIEKEVTENEEFVKKQK